MITIVFALAVANLALGFTLAVSIDRVAVWSMPQFKRRRRTRLPVGTAADETLDETAVAPQDEWSRTLKDAEVNPKSVIERLLWIVKLEIGTRRKRLIELDRHLFDPHSPQTVASELIQELELIHQQLTVWIGEADVLKEPVGPHAELLEELLLDQAFQLRACVDGLEAECEEVKPQLAIAMTAINALRDGVDVLLCQHLLSEDRLHELADRYRTYGERSTLTHLGLATLFAEWWRDDPDQVRLVSIVMLDLDRFESFTGQIGAARSDVALLRFGDMLHDLVRKDRGFDRVARYTGQRFVMFLGDTSAKNAAKGAERIRQAIEATSFKLGENISAVTASLAVIEVRKAEGPREFIPRLEATLDQCKKAGRNCGFVDSGNGPEPIRLPQYQVGVRVIDLDEEAAP